MEWASIRQYFYPSDFRIARPALSNDAAVALVTAILNGESRAKGEQSLQPDMHVNAETQKLVVQIGNAVWRLRRRVVDPSSGKPREEMRKLARHVESLSDALVSFGVDVQDHTNQAFVTGLDLDVIAFEPSGAVQREIVVETVLPSIYLGNTKLQTGKIIVATPSA
jgi:hypothetical protein